MSELLRLPFEKLTLRNGLQVVLHEDHGSPVVAVCVVYHVGSAREVAGLSGLAHLFEHLMFEGSQHVAEGEHFKRINAAGGTLNGTTNRDRTNYYETLPAHQLEMALWLESDRMGYLLPALTQEKLDNQRDVVKNERRQNYENRPYARALWPMNWMMYPDGHPYRWLTIGSHEDIDRATLEDVHAFFRRWYGPNNATLAIGGDFDREEAIALVRRYFESIPRGPEVPAVPAQGVTLAGDLRLVVEDDVQLPELTITWPVAPRFSAEDAALRMMLSILSANSAAILDKALMVDEVLCSRVFAYLNSGEVSGEFRLVLRAAPGIDLGTLEIRLRELLAGFARDGVNPDQLQRMRNSFEASFVQGLETVDARTDFLAEINALRGDPAHAEQELRRVLEVTPEDVLAVFRKYLLDRPAVWASVVPRGQFEWAATGASREQREQEQGLDRSVPPTPRGEPAFRSPELSRHDFGPGVRALSSPYRRLPLVAVELCLAGGHGVETMETLGLSLLTAECMGEGTRTLSTTEFREALDGLGVQLRFGSHEDETSVSLVALRKHLAEALELTRAALTEPRFDAKDFERLRTQRLATLRSRGDHPRTVADLVWRRLIYGREGVAAFPRMGTAARVAKFEVGHVRDFHRQYTTRHGSLLAVAGDFAAGEIESTFGPLLQDLPASPVEPAPAFATSFFDDRPVYLVHKAGAAQSEIRIGHAGPARTEPGYELATAMNYVLGGSFNSRLNTNLREDKGYTYGIYSGMYGGRHSGYFLTGTAVRTEVTHDAVREILAELVHIREDITAAETEFASQSLILAMGRKYESIASLCNLQHMLLKFDLPEDYLLQQVTALRSLSREQLLGAARQYIHPERVAVLVVGDAGKVREPLEEACGRPVVELDIDGEVVERSA